MSFAVADADAAAAEVTAAGGTVPLAPMDVFDVGRFAVALDPAGAAFQFGWGVSASEACPQRGIDGADFGGMVRMDEKFPPEAPPHWLPYFAVVYVDTCAATATQAGGTVLMEPTSVPYGPRITVLRDPQAAVFGVYRAGDEH